MVSNLVNGSFAGVHSKKTKVHMFGLKKLQKRHPQNPSDHLQILSKIGYKSWYTKMDHHLKNYFQLFLYLSTFMLF